MMTRFCVLAGLLLLACAHADKPETQGGLRVDTVGVTNGEADDSDEDSELLEGAFLDKLMQSVVLDPSCVIDTAECCD